MFFYLPGPLRFLLQSSHQAMMTSALPCSSSETACLLIFLHLLILILTRRLLASWKLKRSVGKSYCCFWDGVECSQNSSGHVIALDLSSSFLYGSINSSSNLFSLVHLRRLNLADNDFRFSQIPSGIGSLTQLENLNLSYSLFSGQVPKEISQLSRLVSLDLTGNLLELQALGFKKLVENTVKNLRELFLLEVNIDSEVPHMLANSSTLRSFVLRYCGLRGEFPTDILQLPTLQVLDVQGNNNLHGYLPKFHVNSQLKDLILADTNFHGLVPASLGNLINLKQLDLSSCKFSGPLPGSVSNLTQLTYLNLYNNNFWGRIPSLAGLSRLSYLILFDNNFDGRNLSDWLGKLPKLSCLDLRRNNLSCEIPSSIGNLTQLRQLYLNYNSMVGQIPSSIMNLTHLTNLSLGFNDFTGNLPSLESLSNLSNLFLPYTKLDRWKLPDWLGKLHKLTYLDLSAVNLHGEIPLSMFNLTQLEVLSLSSNQIEGPIPPFPSTMTKLTELDLAENQLKGPIPSSISNLKNLEGILLNDNNISGMVEADIFLSLKKLKGLYLGGNKLTLSAINNLTDDTLLPIFDVLGLESCNLSVFPDFFRFQDQLQELHLDDNQIVGLIPEWLGNKSTETLLILSISHNLLTGFEQRSPVIPWVSLLLLDLRYNMLRGFIPVPPPTTNNYLVSNNNLTGEIPPSICDLKSLQVLDLSFNSIGCSIPPCLEKLSNSLVVLNLRRNTLRGSIPNTFSNSSKLLMINLSENQLKGELPRSLENCASLQILDLGNNEIEDKFPFWLGALTKLEVLILRLNRFHGAISIPSKTHSKFAKLRIVDLSYNSFSGDLPHQYFQQWSAMQETKSDAEYMQATMDILLPDYFWVWNYSYSMKITNKGVTTEYEKIINIFVAVDLSSNKFKGMIPESITSLRNLQLLNLSNNDLSSVIPSYMANLTNLESLDLSGNKLSGKIPQELVKLYFLALLNVSFNNLAGSIPQGGQFSTFLNTSYLGNLALCGDLLSVKCGKSEASKPPKVSLDNDTESNFPSGVDWVCILLGVGSGLVIGLVFGNHLTTRYYKQFLGRFTNWWKSEKNKATGIGRNQGSLAISFSELMN